MDYPVISTIVFNIEMSTCNALITTWSVIAYSAENYHRAISMKMTNLWMDNHRHFHSKHNVKSLIFWWKKRRWFPFGSSKMDLSWIEWWFLTRFDLRDFVNWSEWKIMNSPFKCDSLLKVVYSLFHAFLFKTFPTHLSIKTQPSFWIPKLSSLLLILFPCVTWISSYIPISPPCRFWRLAIPLNQLSDKTDMSSKNLTHLEESSNRNMIFGFRISPFNPLNHT
ncbi:MAG: hypothetical protein Ta2E_13090 [Mycoplasmoidaceae bacterium]|nr:MAG: hypothetical protein Ta2E_13090 [Mycoplasmoidaceae bacterium]